MKQNRITCAIVDAELKLAESGVGRKETFPTKRKVTFPFREKWKSRKVFFEIFEKSGNVEK